VTIYKIEKRSPPRVAEGFGQGDKKNRHQTKAAASSHGKDVSQDNRLQPTGKGQSERGVNMGNINHPSPNTGTKDGGGG